MATARERARHLDRIAGFGVRTAGSKPVRMVITRSPGTNVVRKWYENGPFVPL